ncbi:FMN-binding glutamate synthase family protein [Alkalilimnicola ehrlichii MLHE-1]|uniref:Ferredoxin-dependent glutamate synthase n=1 Tax=Alkalilimnicola ehrlichii (strain ATCC BAA-1101 / DSM 17681 / MLHE-1) TaxID=187272 RepID=Q0AC47_ALKEH|nr:FMN-binding glutamate synthase family protein [Alkalilimnicola ehrlichii]ABI55590.1 ferredoxin-dependent glutamate synthase [Alkalilimnicola ehrlichii MLHE-1]
MSKTLWPVPGRYVPYLICIAAFVISLLCLQVSATWGWGVALFGGLSLLGTWDLLQPRRTISRNYPVIAHLRYCLEGIGPEIRQYFIESDTDERPFSREQRSVVYQRAKNQLDKRPFGSLLNLYGDGYEWVSHSVQPVAVDPSAYRVEIGGRCQQPYSASVFNISAMSFGALSANAILALNKGARLGGFYQDTGEGGISRYHLEHGGDLVWEIGSGYFGCRTPDGSFSPERFAETAGLDSVRMIEIKLSQGAKPGHGGILPAAKVSPEIAAARGVPEGEDVISPPRHSAFSTPRELMQFIGQLRELSGGKPVGFKLAIGHPWEWFALAKAMQASDERPDFIVVDGGEGGTGAAPLESINRLGMPLDEALLLVHNTLVGTGLRDHIRLGAAGKLTSGFKVARTLALGADWCNAARGFMFALGCIQSLSCHTDRCPSGVATQDRRRSRGLHVGDKALRVRNFHAGTVEALGSLLAAAGLSHLDQLTPDHIYRRLSGTEVRSFAELYPFVEKNALLSGAPAYPAVFREYWPRASPDTFHPVTPKHHPSEEAAMKGTA